MATSTALLVAIGLLMVDSIIELSFISSMVGWLHRRAGGSFYIAYGGSSFPLHGKPLHLVLDQGHTSNGAAGTAFVAVGLGGLLVLWLRGRSSLWNNGFVKVLYHVWLVMTILSVLLSLSALIYTFIVTNDYKGQAIDVVLASSLNNQPYPNYVPYPVDTWTPENWFNAILQLNLVQAGDRSAIDLRVQIMRGWRWNLIPMFLIGVVVALLAVSDAFRRRREMRDGRASQQKRNGAI